jgi:hypothetical protein
MLENHYSARKWLVPLVLFVFYTIIMQWQGAVLKSTSIPSGIIALEFANNFEQLHFIISHWQKETVVINIALDFGYIIIYTYFFISLLKLLSGLLIKTKLSKLFNVLAIGFWLATFCDLIENCCMLLSIGGIEKDSILYITTIMASFKFAVILISSVAMIFGLMYKMTLKLVFS